jgi:integrase
MSIKLVQRPKSPNWIMRGTLRGIRVEESTGVSDRRVAEEIRAKREAEILAQSIYGRQATATFAEAAASYLENGGDKRFLAPVISHFGVTALAKIDQDAIDKAGRKLYPDCAAGTINRQVHTPISAVLHHAARRGWCAHPVIERPAQSQGKVRWITPDEADRLIAGCADHLRPLVIFLLYTGARAGEALWLDWQDVDLVRAHVSFAKTKNGEARGVPLHPRVLTALKALPHRQGEVFRRPDGEPYERPRSLDDHSAGTRIKTAFSGACKRAGITKFTPHSCRHTWATWHYAANRDLIALMKLGGWKSERMVLRYAHVNVGELAHTIARLPSTIGGKARDEPAANKKVAQTQDVA